MITKVKLCHILLIWGLAQTTAQLNRGVPAGVRSSMIANGWRPLASYESKNTGQHLTNSGSSLNERHSGTHPVHGKLQEHLAKTEKLGPKLSKPNHHQDYSPPSILGSFSVFGHSVGKVRGNSDSSKSPTNHVASETREYSFLVPPPREPVRYEIDPYRKVILRDNDVFLRQPTQYIISHPIGSDIRNGQYFGKGVAVAASSHSLATTKNRPILNEYNGQQPVRQQQSSQPHFESLKLSNAKLYLQPPSSNGPSSFTGHEAQQQPDNIYERYPASSLLQHGTQLTQESSGNFYTQVNHPVPGYKNPERDPAFLVHESHEVSYATPAGPQPGFAAFGNFRPSSTYDNLHTTHFSTVRPVQTTEKFIPSKPDNTRQKQEHYAQYTKKNPSLDNSIPSEGSFSNGIVNTYYISEQQHLTPPPPAWSPAPAKSKVTPDINEVLPKANRPAKFNTESPNTDGVRQSQNNFLFPRPEIQQQQLQQQYYQSNPLPLINQQQETIYETPESLSLKHFNEQQFRLQQQLLERDRERLREQELHRQQQQIELGRIAAAKEVTTVSQVVTESPRPTIQYIDTTVTYGFGNQPQDVSRVQEQQYVQEYEKNVYKDVRPAPQAIIYEPENVSSVYDFYPKVTTQPEKVTYQTPEVTTSPVRTRQRKPTTTAPPQEPVRRRKPTTTPPYEPQTYHQEEQYRLSTLSPHPIVQSPGITPGFYSQLLSTEQPTPAFQETIFPSIATITDDFTPTTTEPTTTSTTISTTTTTTTQRPRTRRPTVGNVSSGRRRRPSTTTTQEPETTRTSYQEEDYTRYEKVETESTRRRKPKPTTTTQAQTETTSTEKKKFDAYGNKLGSNEQDYVTVSPESYYGGVEQVSPQQSYTYGEHDSLFYTPNHDGNQALGQESPVNYDTSSYSTSSSSSPTREQENISDAEIVKNVYTNIPLEELFINTEGTLATTPSSTTTTTTIRPTTVTRTPYSRTTTVATTTEPAHTTRAPVHRMRPMRFGNSTRPRFSIKDYKSRLDYRSRMSTTTEAPPSRHKTGSLKNTQDNENQPVESTTGRYRHMSRVSYRVSSTTPSYNARRNEVNSTTERINKFTPKRRPNNHLYRSKISSTTPQTSEDDEATTSTRQTSVRNENIFSARRRLPHMKPAMFTSDPRTTRKEATEMIPEETSFYSPAISQLLVTDPSSFKTSEQTEEYTIVTSEDKETSASTPSTTIHIEESSISDAPTISTENSQPLDDVNIYEYSHQAATTASPTNEVGPTEALVKESQATIDSQLEEDLFAKASQSVADLTSSASALYDKPGMFKAVSVSPSSAEGSAVISSRFKINPEKPTLPIEAFFHELSSKN